MARSWDDALFPVAFALLVTGPAVGTVLVILTVITLLLAGPGRRWAERAWS